MLDNTAYVMISFKVRILDKYISRMRNQVEGGA